jgi:two-component sensor histidine kinase
MENEQKKAVYYESGIAEEVDLLEEMLDKNEYPPCVRKGMVTEECLTIKAPQIECPDCPFNEHYSERGTLVKRLQYGEEFFGIMSASIPKEFVQDPEEKILFNEVVGDISYALYNLKIEEKRAEAEAAVQRDLTEKQILIKEIHHRVKNNLNVIASLLNLQSSSISSPEEAQEALKKSYNRVYSMAQIHNSIYQDDSALRLNMSRYIHSIAAELIDLYGSRQGITPIIEIEEVELAVEKATPLGLIIVELLTNSLKHAFVNHERNEKKVCISLKKKEPSLLELKISDNGQGVPKDLLIESSTTLGFQLVTILTDQLDGTLHIDGYDGTEITLEFGKDQN